MKALYIVFAQLIEGDGISKKIRAQHRAFINNGLDMQLAYLSIRGGVKYYVIGDSEVRLGERVSAKLNSNLRYKHLYDYIKSEGVEFVYIRYTSNASANYLRFLRSIKELGVKIFVEIPTYPYDGENKPHNLYDLYHIKRERHYRDSLYRYVDRIVTFSADPKIYNIECINISNAIDFTTIELRSQKPKHDYLRFVAVATLSFWHGYDRMLRAIMEYYNMGHTQPLVYFDIIGDGPMYDSLREMAKDMAIGQYVRFHGKREGIELTELLNDADICVGSLARHRSGITEMKALKNVEYAVRGIPFIYSETNPDFDDRDYIYKVAADESVIDLYQIATMFPYKRFDPQTIRSSVSYLSWDIQMGIVIDALKQIK